MQFPSYSGTVNTICLLTYITIYGIHDLVGIRKRTITNRQRLSPLTRIIYGIQVFISLTYVADCIVVILKASKSKDWDPNYVIFYDIGTFTAWVLNLSLMIYRGKKLGRWGFVNYCFQFLSLYFESVIFHYWITRFRSNKPGTAFSFYDQILLCIIITRYIYLIIVSFALFIHAFLKNNLCKEFYNVYFSF
ncbi:hypothetical protein C1645_765636 [Glomus cerebriforme]|uniref:Uncharacterized protein n=1 Tax=Glomus cerebriforme TaxID=658196 RepID=A0A397T5K1_9GLOM|nr:hypothetical protein C1645_765636 [Glomus cerebriforme]